MSIHPAIIAAVAQATFLTRRLESRHNLTEPAARQTLFAIKNAHLAAADELRALAKKDELP